VGASRNSLAIVLRSRSYGESDKIVTFLTQDCGKLTGIAKGAKRSRRRFPNSLEPLACVRVYFRQPPQATLAFLESCELVRPAAGLTDPARFAYGSYLAELTDQLMVEEQPARELYALLAEGLAALEEGPVTGAFLRSFELQALARAGFAPQIDRCNRCQRLLLSAQPALLDVAHGTFSCGDCRVAGTATVGVPAGVLPRLAVLRELPLADCQQRSLGVVATAAAQLTGHLLALHLSRPLQAVKLIEQLAASAG